MEAVVITLLGFAGIVGSVCAFKSYLDDRSEVRGAQLASDERLQLAAEETKRQKIIQELCTRRDQSTRARLQRTGAASNARS